MALCSVYRLRKQTLKHVYLACEVVMRRICLSNVIYSDFFYLDWHDYVNDLQILCAWKLMLETTINRTSTENHILSNQSRFEMILFLI